MLASAIRHACLTLAAIFAFGCFSPEEKDDLESTGGATDTADSTQGSTGMTGQAEACASYCTLVGDHCEGDQEQYGGTVQCEATCAVMEAGEEGAVSGNTVACRTVHAINAGEDPQTHCIHAGPAGGGVCGGECESFCSHALLLCTGDNEAFADFEDCAADCGQFPTEPPYTSSVPDGDSFACRMHHLTLASLAPETHCPHIVLDSPICN